MNLSSYFKTLIILCTLTFCVPTSNVRADTSIPVSSFNSCDLLLDKIFAVHATRTLPESHYLRAGWALDKPTFVEQAVLPKVRKTLHFALGELVRPVEGFMSWEDCPYAIVTPVRNLLPQLININCYDTFILGDLALSPKTYLILPIDATKHIASQATLVTYDPRTTTLRQAVDKLILSKGGWHIEMNSDDIEDTLHEAYLEGRNVNSLEFFEPLKKDRPWLAVGVRFNALDGDHYRLSQIEQPLVMFAMSILSNTYLESTEYNSIESSYLEDAIILVNEHFENWSQALADFTWGPESQHAYQQIEVEIKKWEQLMHEELRLRKVYKKTLMSAPELFLIDFAVLLNQPDLLRGFIEANYEQLHDYPKKI